MRAAVAAGKDAYFASSLRGLTGLNQTAQGIVQGVDIPVSNDIPAWLARINWAVAAAQRVTWWNDCIYWAVALDSSTTNNAVLVYDLRLHQWVSRDAGLNVQDSSRRRLGGWSGCVSWAPIRLGEFDGGGGGGGHGGQRGGARARWVGRFRRMSR